MITKILPVIIATVLSSCMGFQTLYKKFSKYSLILGSAAELVNQNDLCQETLDFIINNKDQLPPFVSVPDNELLVEAQLGGVTNFCYKVCCRNDPTNAVFVKHAKDYIRERDDILLTKQRLRYEYEGMIAFSKFYPSIVPKTYLLNEPHSYLVNEYLNGYSPLSHVFINGYLPPECARSMGTLMGRSHARTHSAAVPEKTERYKTMFANSEHFTMWSSHIFPVLRSLVNTHTKSLSSSLSDSQPTVSKSITSSHQTETENKREKEIKREICEVLQTLNNDEHMSHAIDLLYQIYMEKKQCLIHGDLHGSNIMISSDPDPLFKVIDFEKTAMGPPGLDVGIFLSNFLWYYSAHPNSAVRRTLAGSFRSCIDAYMSAFIVQMSGIEMERERKQERERQRNSMNDLRVERRKEGHRRRVAGPDTPPRDWGPQLEEILRDTAGFMGLYILSLLTALPSGLVPSLSGVPGMSFGDTHGWKAALTKRQLYIVSACFRVFLQTRPVTLDDLYNILIEDNYRLTTEHKTEFWF